MSKARLYWFTSLVNLALLIVAACGGGGGGGAGGGAVDVSGLVGLWNGTATITLNGQTSSATNAYTHITAQGTELTIGDFCFDGTGPAATATKSTEFTVHAISCPPATVGNCNSVILGVASGSGSLSGATLTMNTTGTIAGCGVSTAYTFSFSGHK